LNMKHGSIQYIQNNNNTVKSPPKITHKRKAPFPGLFFIFIEV